MNQRIVVVILRYEVPLLVSPRNVPNDAVRIVVRCMSR